MSLDVYLEVEGAELYVMETGIMVRENGRTKKISREEWDKKHPGCEPVVMEPDAYQTDTVFHANITHNLGKMAGEAGLYKPLWRPEEVEIEKAAQLINPLSVGLKSLEASPNKFKAFNPSNGWGTYEGLVEFVREYLQACRQWPEATVRVWR